jgi:site-specific DNA recombinase
MTTRRCAIYARYSSDLQRESSIDDQLRKCREFAEKQDWIVLDAYIRFDEAISGAALVGRDALQDLIRCAKQSPRPFDTILVEDSSRLARNLADQRRTVETLGFHGVSVFFVSQNIDTRHENSPMLLAMHGIMDEQFLVGLGQKVHRGQEGRVLQRMNPGGRCYGYRNVPIEDATRQGKYGRMAVLGVNQEIIPEEADVVRHIFKMYSDGHGFATIAKQLNSEGIPSPKPAKNRLHQAWSRYTIREMLFNERYRGVIVWNRTRKTRNPETGRKVSKTRPESEWKRVDAPELRIVPEALWKCAHEQNTQARQLGVQKLGGMNRTPQSRTYLFSGMLVCGDCGSSVVIISGGGKRGYVKYGCHAHKHSGVCDNNWTIRRDRLEEQLLSAIEQRLFDPETLNYAVQKIDQAIKLRIADLQKQAQGSNGDQVRKRREELKSQAARFTEAIGLGGNIPTLVQKLQEIEREAQAIDRAITTQRPRNIELKPDQIRDAVMKTMMSLRSTLNEGDATLAKNALMKHVGRLVLTPTMKEGKKFFRVTGGVQVTGPNGVMQVVARDGIEPPTPAFSGLLTDNAKWFRISAGDCWKSSYVDSSLGPIGMI